MKYDLAVIGGGPGGYTAAEYAARRNLSVVLFEADKMGGTCLNRGCIPTKALLFASERYRAARESGGLGITAEQVRYDFSAMHARKQAVVETLREGVEKRMKAAGVTVVNAFARVVSCEEGGIVLEAGGEAFTARDLIVAAGSSPAVPPVPGSGLEGVYTSNELLEGKGLDVRSLLIIGGGVIGCELASFYLDLGAKVTILEAMDRILPTMEREIAQRLTMFLKKRGAAVQPSVRVAKIEGRPGAMKAVYSERTGKEGSCEAEAVLIAAGRRTNAAELFPPAVSPAGERGALAGDEQGRTSVPHVYVIGDAKAGNVQLAHVAEAQGKCAVAAILQEPAPVDLAVIPSCIYTEPEIASVGLTEEGAKAAGIPVKTKKALTGANGKCVIEGGEAGYCKLVVHAETGVLLGAQLIAPRATDLIAELSLAIASGLSAEDVAAVIHPHPTFSELIAAACET